MPDKMQRLADNGILAISNANSRVLDVIGQAGGLAKEAAQRVELYPADAAAAAPEILPWAAGMKRKAERGASAAARRAPGRDRPARAPCR